MTPAFQSWFSDYLRLQFERDRGIGGDLWARIADLEARMERLAIEGLDVYDVARAFLAIERGAVLYEERRYDEALVALAAARLNLPSALEVAAGIEGNRNLIEGNVLLVQERYEEAAVRYAAALDVKGKLPDVRGNAAFNLGTIRQLQENMAEARTLFERAADEYQRAGMLHKLPDCWHQIGNILRERDETLGQALHQYLRALNQYVEDDNFPGQWRAADDLARLWFVWGTVATSEKERAQYFEQALVASTGAAMSAARLWRDEGATEGRLADLSDQLLNHTMTQCEICAVTGDMLHLLSTLAVNKGRIRAVREQVQAEAVAGIPKEHQDDLANDDPRAYLGLVHNALPRLNRTGETIAIVDQLAMRGDRLLTSVTIVGGEKFWEVISSELYPPNPKRLRRSLRSRDRCREVESVVQRVFRRICKHGELYESVVGTKPEPDTENERETLAEWAIDLDEDLETLGRWFFPDALLEMLEACGVSHVVFVPEPLFATVPYPALRTSKCQVLDLPWSLSIVSSTMELLRLAYRPVPSPPARPLVWLAPDELVNILAGNVERAAVEAHYPVEPYQDARATVARACATLADGRWVHFCGHGRWNTDIINAGPILHGGHVLDRTALESLPAGGGFLVTAACQTGSGEAVGTELFGSLVDYDRGDLRGALLTRWPLPMHAPVRFMDRFYGALQKTGHVAKALQIAARQTRDAAPHPYVWAPYVALGAWEVTPA